jgi:hypothetical protein
LNAPNKPPQHLFAVSIDVELAPETVKQIAQAIQKSVLVELASIQLSGPLAINFLGEGQAAPKSIFPGGHTQGITIRTA